MKAEDSISVIMVNIGEYMKIELSKEQVDFIWQILNSDINVPMKAAEVVASTKKAFADAIKNQKKG